MATTREVDRLRKFSAFRRLPDEATDDLRTHAQVLRVPSGHILTTPGDLLDMYPLVLSGRARIFVTDREGREITLYRLEPGDGCVLAASCALTGTPSPSFSCVEVGGRAMIIPATALRAWMERHAFWRDYVFSLIATQLSLVLTIINQLAFERLDARIAGFLLSIPTARDHVDVTHDVIARELGTRREVVSRILKVFEHEEMVELERGRVTLSNRRRLEARAKGT